MKGFNYGASDRARRRRKAQGRCATCEQRTGGYWCSKCGPVERGRIKGAVAAMRARRRQEGRCIECAGFVFLGQRCLTHAAAQWVRDQGRQGRVVTVAEGEAWAAQRFVVRHQKKTLDKEGHKG